MSGGRRELLEEHPRALLRVVDDLGGANRPLLALVGVQRAAAAEGIAMPADLEAPDRAEVLAGLAGELLRGRRSPSRSAVQVEVALLDQALFVLLEHQPRDAEAAHELGVGRDGDRLAGHLREGQRHGRVLGHAALQHDVLADRRGCPPRG